MLKRLFSFLDKNIARRELEQFSKLVAQINALEATIDRLPDEALAGKTDEFRNRLSNGAELKDLLPEAFALVRSAARRAIGLRLYDVQLIGGAVLQGGAIAEMRTGEGKTLVAVAPLYLNALEGQGAHLVTVNDYLARRDARWMGPVFHLLGLSVGLLQSGSGGGETPAFLFDPQHNATVETEHMLRPVPRKDAYLADVTYGTNSEFGFDHLRDNLVRSPAERVQRGHAYAIVDEVDNVLIDEARTPLIIAGENARENEWYLRMAEIVKSLHPRDVEVNRKEQTVTLTLSGDRRVEGRLGLRLRDPNRPEEATPEQRHLIGHLEQALRARYLFQRDREYLVQDGQVIIIDEFTGRSMPGRRWTDGLHQAVEAKEGVPVQSESMTLATISLQNYFRLYRRLAGMTGTALPAAKEFEKTYHLPTHPIPTHVEYQAFDQDSLLEERQGKTEDGQPFRYYIHRGDRQNKPVFFQRIDYPDIIFRSNEAKLREIAWEVLWGHVNAQPILVGTTSVADSEQLSSYLQTGHLRRLVQIRLLRRAWLAANPQADPQAPIPELNFTNRPLGLLDAARLTRQMEANKLELEPAAPANLETILKMFQLPASYRERLATVLENGIAHQVLNARYHYEESQIIAGAGTPGAVTIATNMAGRGVDIKLGGELAEEISAAVALVLQRNGRADAYNLTPAERRDALQAIPQAEWAPHQSEVEYFIQHMEAMQTARALGGLHVIGGTRHESRRIDQQLRGRAARQGDPGTSRFFVSLEDDLLVRYGGLEAQDLIARLEQSKIDESLPLPSEIAQKVVETAQNRAEDENFDIRKRLLEYDDVLNAQRSAIYRQRDRILDKPDLNEDIHTMLAESLSQRARQYITGEGQAWKFLAWLEQVQPTFSMPARGEGRVGVTPASSEPQSQLSSTRLPANGEGREGDNPATGPSWPTYALQLVLDAAPFEGDYVPSTAMLLDLAAQAVQAEQAYLMQTVTATLEQADLQLAGQVEESMEVVHNFLRNLEPEDVIEQPRQMIRELADSLGFPVELNGPALQAFKQDPYSAIDVLRPQVESAVYESAAAGLQGSLEGLLGEPFPAPEGPIPDWDILASRLNQGARAVLDARAARLFGESGSLPQRLAALSSGLQFPLHMDQACLLMEALRLSEPDSAAGSAPLTPVIPVFSYLHLGAQSLEGVSADEAAENALEHLLEGLQLVAGGSDLTPHYRRTLLGVIDEHWIEFLSEMEALRYEVRLEGLAQNDPVVVYKSRAAERFGTLLINLREETVARIFQFGPAALREISAESSAIELPDPKRTFLKLG